MHKLYDAVPRDLIHKSECDVVTIQWSLFVENFVICLFAFNELKLVVWRME